MANQTIPLYRIISPSSTKQEFATSGVTRMVLADSGNLGIGTTAPGHLLHVKKPSSGDSTLLLETVTGGDPTIIFNSAAANRNGLIKFQDNGTNVGRIEYEHNGDKIEFQAGSATGASLTIENGGLILSLIHI